jgi:molecular chaperone DnaK (HSP70)
MDSQIGGPDFDHDLLIYSMDQLRATTVLRRSENVAAIERLKIDIKKADDS